MARLSVVELLSTVFDDLRPWELPVADPPHTTTYRPELDAARERTGHGTDLHGAEHAPAGHRIRVRLPGMVEPDAGLGPVAHGTSDHFDISLACAPGLARLREPTTITAAR